LDILLTSLGSIGDINPMIGVGRALKNEGLRVRFITNGYFKVPLKKAGIDIIEIGDVRSYRRALSNHDLWDPLKGFKILQEEMFLPATLPVYECIKRNLSKRTLIISSPFAYGARMAHERFNVSGATIVLQPSGLWATAQNIAPERLVKMLDIVWGPKINRARQSVGLPGFKNIFGEWIYSPQLVIGLFPKWFMPPNTRYPSNTRFTGFLGYDGPPSQGLKKEVKEFISKGDEPLLFTFGTEISGDDSFFEAIIGACRILKKRGIILTRNKSAIPGSLPKNMLHVDYLPFSKILPHVAAFVHHGGIGTIAQGLAAGVPQLAIPRNLDQPFNAEMLRKVGVGTVLEPDGLDGKELAKKLRTLLTSTPIKNKCLSIAKKTDLDRGVLNVLSKLHETFKI